MKKIAILIFIVEILISCNFEPTRNEVIAAVEAENIILIEEYFSRGFFIDTFYIQGKTPLTFAVEKGNVDLVQLFLENGIDPNRQNIDETIPISFSNTPAISILLKNHGADIRTIICNGGTICKVLVLENNGSEIQVQFINDCEYSDKFLNNIFMSEANINYYQPKLYPLQSYTPQGYKNPYKEMFYRQKHWNIHYKSKYGSYVNKSDWDKRELERQRSQKIKVDKAKEKFFSQFHNFKKKEKAWIKASIFDNPEKVNCEQLGKSENLWKLGEKEMSLTQF